MREYLFKAKTMPNGTIGSSKWIESHHIGSVYLKSAFIGGVYCYPESVGQYTGFLDRNKKKIFKGHIIKWFDRQRDKDCIGVVIWNDSRGIWKVTNDKTHAHNFLCNVYVCSTIIGNYFDSPELLEKLEEKEL